MKTTTYRKLGVFAPFKDDNELQKSIEKLRNNLNTAYHWDLVVLLGRLEQTLNDSAEYQAEQMMIDENNRLNEE